MANIGLTDLLYVTPIIILFITSLIPITVKVLSANREQSPIGTLAPAFLGLIASAVLMQILPSEQPKEIFYGTLVYDGVSVWVGTLVLVLTAGVLFLSRDSASTPGNQLSEYTFLLMNSAVGMLILVSAADLMTVFIGLETMSLALYILIAISNEQKLAKESAFKYFILGSFASAIFLYGTAFLFGTVGSTSLQQIAIQSSDLILSDRLFVFGVILVVLAFCFKISIFPFHAWTPDVYQGASTPITAYMSTAIKSVSIIAFFRFMSTGIASDSVDFVDSLQWLAVGTMLVGNVGAVLQNNLKRVLAFSSIAHSGYMMMAILVAATSTEHLDTATQSLIFYLFSYGFMTLGALSVICYFEKYEETMVNVDDLSGVATKYPLIAIAFAVFMLSLAGIPPTVGFFAKLSLFTAVLAEEYYWLALWGVINSVISVYYYLRPVVAMYMKPFAGIQTSQRATLTLLTVFLCAGFVIIFGLFSSPLYSVVEQASR